MAQQRSRSSADGRRWVADQHVDDAAAGWPSGGPRSEIYEMQVQAIARAAKAVAERSGRPPRVEIMHPLGAYAEELHRLRKLTERVIGLTWPRPRVTARDDDRASAWRVAGGGSLSTRTSLLRHERSDADGARPLARRRGRQVPHRLHRAGVAEHNPSETLDRVGVGELIEFGVKRSRVSGVECPASASVCE